MAINARKAEQSIEQKISRADLGGLDLKNMETQNVKVSGHRERSKVAILGTKHSGNEQIRICIFNTPTNEENSCG